MMNLVNVFTTGMKYTYIHLGDVTNP